MTTVSLTGLHHRLPGCGEVCGAAGCPRLHEPCSILVLMGSSPAVFLSVTFILSATTAEALGSSSLSYAESKAAVT